MSQNIEGKVAIITGALGGIGKEFTKALLRNKIKGIALLDLNPAQAEFFQKELEDSFGSKKTIFIETDATSTEQLKVAFERTISQFGHVDIVVNNAGIDGFNFEKCMDLNVMGVMRSMHLAFENFLPKYKCGKDSYIVNIASIMGLAPSASFPTYSVSKYAVVGMSLAYGTELLYNRYGVKVLTICPGGTETSLVDNFRSAEFPELSVRELYSFQRPEIVGEALITALNDGENGSVWLVELNKMAVKIDLKEVFDTLSQKMEANHGTDLQ